MATSTITPSAPAASPSSSPAPASAPVASPAPASQPSGPRPSLEQRFRETGKQIAAEVDRKIQSPEAPETKESPEGQPEAPETTEVQPDKQSAEELAASGQEVPEEKPAEGTEEQAEFQALDLGESVGADKFNAAVEADAGAKAFFEQNKELKESIAGALRRDEENREFREWVPDLQTAKDMSTAAASYSSLDNAFMGATTPEGTRGFMRHWADMATIRDASGNPVLDANGNLQVEPAFTNIFQHVFNGRFGYLIDQARQSGQFDPLLDQAVMARLDGLQKSIPNDEANARIHAAIDVIKDAIPDSSKSKTALPPEVQQIVDDAKREKAEFSAQKQQERETANQESIERSNQKAFDSAIAQLNSAFSTAGLNAIERSWVQQEVGNKLDAALEALPWYKAEKQAIESRPPSAEREKALTAHILKYQNGVLGKIAAAAIRDAKKGAIDRQTEKAGKVAGQVAVSRTEPKGTSSGAAQNKASLSDPKGLQAQIRKQYSDANGGRHMPVDLLFKELAKRGVGTLPGA